MIELLVFIATTVLTGVAVVVGWMVLVGCVLGVRKRLREYARRRFGRSKQE